MRYLLHHECMGGWQSGPWDDRDEAAEILADDRKGAPPCTPRCRIVRLLTPAESRRKAQAEALREAACDARARADDRLRNYADWRGQSAHLIDADALDAKADALWPRKGRREAPTRGKWVVGDDGLAREVGGL